MQQQALTELVVQAQGGNADALQKLLEEYYQDLYFFAFKTVQDQDLACDIIQESCIEIMVTLPNLRIPAAFPAWARKITYHQCTRHFRQNREVQPLEDEDGETIFDRLPDESEGSLPEQVYDDKEFRQIMQELLDSLPADQRAAMMMYYYENMSVKDIAAVQDTTEGTVKSRLYYGRNAVKAKVEDYEKKHGVRLHSMALLPLLLLFLFDSAKNEVSAAGAYTAVQSALAAGTAGAAGTTVAAQSAGAGAAGVMGKVIAGVLAAGVTVGGVCAGVALSKGGSQTAPQASVTQTAPTTVHTHSYGMEYDENQHWSVCACGDTTQAQMHSYQSGICSQCSYELPTSEGLSYAVYGDYCTVTGMGSCEDTILVIPAQHEGKAVRYIGRQAFEGRNLVEVILPDTVAEIDFRAFAGCPELRRIHPGKGMKQIGLYAFSDCEALEEIRMPDGMQKILSNAFYGCASLVDVDIPQSVTEIQDSAFRNCTKLQTLKLNGGVIQDQAFAGCISLGEVTFGQNVTQIGKKVFSGCVSLQTAELPDSLTTMGDQAFENCTALTRASIPGSVLTVPAQTFNNCTALNSVVLGEGITTLENGVFANCRSLQQLTLPDSLIIVGSSLFDDCISLKELVIPSGVNAVPLSCFEGCVSLNQVTLPSGITRIDSWAFIGCTGLHTIHFNGSVSQWYGIERIAVSPSFCWNAETGEFVVSCTDGTIAKEDA